LGQFFPGIIHLPTTNYNSWNQTN